jgi:hypothetical protein
MCANNNNNEGPKKGLKLECTTYNYRRTIENIRASSDAGQGLFGWCTALA